MLGVAELERKFGGNNVSLVNATSALIKTDQLNVSDLGGALKAGLVLDSFSSRSWQDVSQKVVRLMLDRFSKHEGKITLGISEYGSNISPRDVQKIGITLKQRLKNSSASLRLIPNQDSALSSATSHHNKLGLSDNKVEILIVSGKNGKTYVALSVGAQNITAYAKRDQGRPKRDAFVGMLPPKLAQIIINLAVGDNITLSPFKDETDGSVDDTKQPVILDPFCGTGVILQEAALMGYSVYGTDLAEKMIRYTRDNLNWLEDTLRHKVDWYLHEGDAMNTKWRQPIAAIAAEGYLGQPFSAPPSPAKLNEVRDNCDHIISTFLKNLSGQIPSGTPVCLAVPAWKKTDGTFTHLPLIDTIAKLGFKPYEFHNASARDLLYYREDQVVARELLVLTKI